MIKQITQNTSAYDARFAASLGGSEYDDLLIAIDYYNEFQAEVAKTLGEYVEDKCQALAEIRVLEAGPGTGITTFELIKVDPRIRIVAVDNEPKMLQAVSDKFDDVPELKGKVEFISSDILEFLKSCPDKSFDAFVSVYTLHNFTPEFRREVIRLIAQKLKKGGVFINGDKYARENGLHKADYATEIKNFDKFLIVADQEEKAGNPTRGKHLRNIRDEWIKHYAEDEKNKITVEEQDKMLEEFGFEDVRWGKRHYLVTTVRATKS